MNLELIEIVSHGPACHSLVVLRGELFPNMLDDCLI